MFNAVQEFSMKIKSVVFFPNGNSIVFDKDGEQISELQKSWFRLFIKHLDKHKADYENAEILMPDGRKANIINFEGGWNWEIN